MSRLFRLADNMAVFSWIKTAMGLNAGPAVSGTWQTYLKLNPKKGFTLIELMIVMAIIATLAGIALPNFNKARERAQNTRVIAEIKLIEKEIMLYQIDSGELPDSLADIGLDTLRDPWGNPYEYLNFTTVKGVGQMRKDHSMVPVNTDYDLYSKGADGQSSSPFTADESHDDIVRANNGQYIGLVSDY